MFVYGCLENIKEVKARKTGEWNFKQMAKSVNERKKAREREREGGRQGKRENVAEEGNEPISAYSATFWMSRDRANPEP